MTHSSRFLSAAVPTLALVTLIACGTSDTAGRQPLGAPADANASAAPGTPTGASGPQLPLAARTALDAGNAAYRAKQFDAALAQYRAAAAAAPEHAAPWFGIYMVANDMKNTSLADSAMSHAKALSADPAALDAHAAVSAEAAGGAGALPSGHPSTTPELPAGHPSTTPLPPGRPAPTKLVKPPRT